MVLKSSVIAKMPSTRIAVSTIFVDGKACITLMASPGWVKEHARPPRRRARRQMMAARCK